MAKADSGGVTLAGVLGGKVGSKEQEQVAEALGVSQSTLSRWIGGTLVPGDDRVPELARFLKMSEEDVAFLLYRSRKSRLTTSQRLDRLEEKLEELTRIVLEGRKRR